MTSVSSVVHLYDVTLLMSEKKTDSFFITKESALSEEIRELTVRLDDSPFCNEDIAPPL